MFEVTEHRNQALIHLGRHVFVLAEDISVIYPRGAFEDPVYQSFGPKDIAAVKSWVVTGGGQLVPAFVDAYEVAQRWACKRQNHEDVAAARASEGTGDD